MKAPSPPNHVLPGLVAYYRSGDVIRSRSVSDVLLSGVVDVPAPPARLVADWNREISLRLKLEPGDVEQLPLARALMRWPDYRHCVQGMADWLATLGLSDVLATSDVALMACRGARYHHDGAQYGSAAFCNLFLIEDRGLDLHFPETGRRIPLTRGTAVIFDTGQPHAVILRRGADADLDTKVSGFNAVDFPTDLDCIQVFLTWELPIENADVAQALQIAFDIDPQAAFQTDNEQVWHNGTAVNVCPNSGHFTRKLS